MDFGKEKFGGPFTEEEVVDVKTIIQLLPLVACLSLSVGTVWQFVHLNPFDNQYINCVLDVGTVWISALVLVPLYQFLLYPFFHKWVPSGLYKLWFHITTTTSGLFKLWFHITIEFMM